MSTVLWVVVAFLGWLSLVVLILALVRGERRAGGLR